MLAPDPDSRTREFEGRRIAEMDGGWRLLNHAKYRAIRDEEERRTYKTAKQREYRVVDNVDNCGPPWTAVDSGRHIAEAEAKQTKAASESEIDIFEKWAEAAYRRHPKKKLKPIALHALVERFARDVPARTTFDENHALWCATTTWTKEHGSFVPCLGEWIKDDGWLTPPPQPKEIEWFPQE